MKQFDYTIKDELGIHARPAALLVKAASAFASAITITKDEKNTDGKKILEIMNLGAECGDTITLSAEGADEDAAIEALEKFVNETW